MTGFGDLIVGAIIVILIGAWVGFVRLAFESGRSDVWRRAAEDLGLDFEEEADRLLSTDLARLRFFSWTDGEVIKNVVCSGSETPQIMVFEYVSLSRANKKLGKHVTCVRDPARNLPWFRIEPKRFLSEYYGTVPFTEVPEFSRRYLVYGKEEERVRELIGKELQQMIGTEKGWSIEGLGEWLIVYRGRIKPTEIAAYLGRAESISRALRVSDG